MRVPAGVVVLLGVLLLSGGLTVFVASPTATALSGADDDISAQSIEVVVDTDGDARIVLTQSMPAETDAELSAFSALAGEFERGEHEIGGASIIGNVDNVADTTGRDMTITNQTRTSTVENGTGYLRHEFGWRNFGSVDGESIEVGDGFHDGTGHWLGTLTGDQRLIVTVPDQYRLETDASRIESTTLAEGRIIWEGPISFEEGDIRLILEPAPAPPAEPTIAPSAVLLGLGVLVLVVGALWWVRKQADDDGEIGAESPPDNPPDERPAADTPEEQEDPVDPELLSDEERVEQMLIDRGGRMKQSAIVEETNWSSAKVSQLLSEMEENGRIEKLRIGRENLISLAEESVTEP